MILLQPIVEILAVAMPRTGAQDRAGITVVPIRGHRSGVTPVTILADSKNVFAAAISRLFMRFRTLQPVFASVG